MSRWYVLLIAMMPATAPASMRSTGVSVPSPVCCLRLFDSSLRGAESLWGGGFRPCSTSWIRRWC